MSLCTYEGDDHLGVSLAPVNASYQEFREYSWICIYLGLRNRKQTFTRYSDRKKGPSVYLPYVFNQGVQGHVQWWGRCEWHNDVLEVLQSGLEMIKITVPATARTTTQLRTRTVRTIVLCVNLLPFVDPPRSNEMKSSETCFLFICLSSNCSVA